MKKFQLIPLSLLLFSAASFTFCQPEDFITLIPELNEQDDYQTCKALPDNPEQTIIAQASSDNDEDYALQLWLVDTQQAKIIAQTRLEQFYISDAIHLDSITIDTGRYHLANNLRAFGITASHEGSSRPNPFSKTTLSLFIKQQDKLVPVLEHFYTLRNSGEWDTNCRGKFSEISRNLIISKTQHNGLFDIKVKEKIDTQENFVDHQGECQYDDFPTKYNSFLLQFDGNNYQALNNPRAD